MRVVRFRDGTKFARLWALAESSLCACYCLRGDTNRTTPQHSDGTSTRQPTRVARASRRRRRPGGRPCTTASIRDLSPSARRHVRTRLRNVAWSTIDHPPLPYLVSTPALAPPSPTEQLPVLVQLVVAAKDIATMAHRCQLAHTFAAGSTARHIDVSQPG